MLGQSAVNHALLLNYLQIQVMPTVARLSWKQEHLGQILKRCWFAQLSFEIFVFVTDVIDFSFAWNVLG